MRPKLARKHAPDYFLRASEEHPEEGPFPIEVLREKASSGEIVPETWFRLEGEESYRKFADDPALVADLWPEEGGGFPAETDEEVEAVAAEVDRGEPSGDSGGNVTEILGDNAERGRASRIAAGELKEEEGFDWRTLSAWKWIVLRWVVAVPAVVFGISIWLASEGSPYDFFIGLALVLLAIFLALPEMLRLVLFPFTSLIDGMMEGSGGGKDIDFWTADSLMEQGEYRLAAAEYRRIAIQNPRNVEAYLKGARAARALNSPREVDRFREMALKNLRTEQDRNLFLNSLKRMEQGEGSGE